MNTTDPIDQAAQEQEDHKSMVEATTDRQILADMDGDFGTVNKCDQSPTGKHEGKFDTITPMDEAEPNHWILDIECKHCGRSGAFRVDPDDVIDW